MKLITIEFNCCEWEIEFMRHICLHICLLSYLITSANYIGFINVVMEIGIQSSLLGLSQQLWLYEGTVFDIFAYTS